MSLVLGIENARVVCTSGSRTITYDLPLTNLQGRQIEHYDVVKVRHEVQSLDIDNPEITILEKVLGYRISWDFSYSSYIEGADVVKMKNILDRYKQGYKLTLFPRVDELWRYFEVIPDNDTLSLGITSGGYSGGNDSWNFRFITKNLEQDLKLQVIIPPPVGTTGYVAYTLNNIAIG